MNEMNEMGKKWTPHSGICVNSRRRETAVLLLNDGPEKSCLSAKERRERRDRPPGGQPRGHPPTQERASAHRKTPAIPAADGKELHELLLQEKSASLVPGGTRTHSAAIRGGSLSGRGLGVSRLSRLDFPASATLPLASPA